MGETALLVLLVASLLAGAARAADATDSPRCRSAYCIADPEDESGISRFTLYGGVSVSMQFKDKEKFVMRCDPRLAADDPALPALPEAVTVDKAVFQGCRAPASSYPAALAALSVTVTHTLMLYLQPNEPSLASGLLDGLTVSSLIIESWDQKIAANLTDSLFLAGLKLQALRLTSVTLSPGVLWMLPDSLEDLELTVAFESTVESRSLLWMARLTLLRNVILVDLDKQSTPLTPPPLAQLPHLTDLTLSVPLSLPQNWLNGSALTMLSLHNCRLTKLPQEMFQGINLTKLSLVGNNLTELPLFEFSPLRWLKTLDVRRNALRGAALWRAAARLPALTELVASFNPLGAACPEDQGLSAPSSLRVLRLAETGATRVCAAWAAIPALWNLDLSDNSIAALSYQELKVSATAGAGREVALNLRYNPLRVLDVAPSDLAACRREGLQYAKVRLTLTALRCDCSNSLLAELLRDCSSLLELAEDPPCEPTPAAPAPRSLLAHRPDQLLCACPARYNFSVPGCSCNKRMLHNATVVQCTGDVPKGTRWPPGDSSQPLALHVAGGGLDAVPRAALVELHAANNFIHALNAEDVNDTLLLLDLRNNSIAHVSEEAARRLSTAGPSGAPRRIWLSGNPLACDCADRAAIELLKSVNVRAQINDWNELRCSDGRELSTLILSELCSSALLSTLLIAGSIMLLLLLLVMSTQRWARPRLKQFLFDRQLCLGWVLQTEDAVDNLSKTHDVFISYAYEDRELAAKLLRHLEERGYSTVEHSRDWQAGVPVAEHIANSVQCARRTLLLVTDSFAASSWGLQEFRAAHTHALERGSARVLPVRCGLSSPQELPDDLRLYLQNNTYLSWDDPDFWEKLWRVMPPLVTTAM